MDLQPMPGDIRGLMLREQILLDELAFDDRRYRPAAV